MICTMRKANLHEINRARKPLKPEPNAKKKKTRTERQLFTSGKPQ